MHHFSTASRHRGSTPDAAPPPNLPAGVVAAVCAGLLQQSVERIARVRETAIRQLRALLGEPRVVAAMPAAAAVSAALPTDDDQLTGVVSLEAVRRLAGLLAVSPQHYTRALLEGLVASVGGVDAALARAASSALVDAIQAASQVGTAAGGEGQVAAHTPAEVLVAATLLQIWQAHAKSPRMAGPVLRTADLLVTRLPGIMAVPVPAVPKPAPTAHSVSDNKASDTAASTPVAPQQAQPAESTFADVMVELCRAETRQCTDVSRLLDAANLLCHLLPARNPCRTSAYQGLLVLLGSRYPTVCPCCKSNSQASNSPSVLPVLPPTPACCRPLLVAVLAYDPRMCVCVTCRCGGIQRSSCTWLCLPWSQARQAGLTRGFLRIQLRQRKRLCWRPRGMGTWTQ